MARRRSSLSRQRIPGAAEASGGVSSPLADASPRSAPRGRDEFPHPLRPTGFEVAAGFVWGEERPPCLVSFSGGRDSSIVLVAATRAARREGLELPVPITQRFRDAPMTDESSWQELVIRHLGISNWEIREFSDEADCIGPLSTAVLRRHGVLFPPNRFLHLPLLEAARGGALLTGVGGDQIFATWRWRSFADLLARRRRPTPRDLLRLGYLVSPRPLRRGWERRQQRRKPLAWLRPDAGRAVESSIARERAAEPARWTEWVGWRTRRRELAAVCWSFRLLADDLDVLVLHPLIDPGFLSTVARIGGRLGLGERTAAMQLLFDQVLPEELITRRTKAKFDEALWRTHTRAFVDSWDGAGVDEELVDPVALAEEWRAPSPSARSAMLLQSAWLSRQRGTRD